jgi:hypothetical protein
MIPFGASWVSMSSSSTLVASGPQAGLGVKRIVRDKRRQTVAVGRLGAARAWVGARSSLPREVYV